MHDADTVPGCVGCGWCCLHDQCDLSHRLYGYQRRCPDIFWCDTTHRYWCKQAVAPQNTSERTELFIGEGCCNRFNSWRDDVTKRE